MKRKWKSTLEKLKFWENDEDVIKVLSLDGGGIRGIIPAMILQRLEELTKKPTAELFDLIAGTSTGGIVALCLVHPGKYGHPKYKASDLVSMYEKSGIEIFSQSMWKQVKSAGTFMESKYDNTGLVTVLDRYLGDTMLSEALTETLIVSYEIEQREACFFKRSNARRDKNYDLRMSDIAKATSSAPTYFVPARIDMPFPMDPFVLIDGGVVANNPAMCALVEAMNKYPKHSKFLVVSLGTGELLQGYSFDAARSWGLTGWLSPLINILFHGNDSTTDHQLKQLLPNDEDGKRWYYRFQTRLKRENEAMDDASPQNIESLKEQVRETILEPREEELIEVAKRLVGNR